MGVIFNYEFGEKIGECVYLYETNLYIGSNGRKTRMAIFKCKCGHEFITRIQDVKSGRTKSCGCLRINKPNRTSHGLKHHPFYRKWKSIKSRCFNKKVQGYKNYGGRGITMCDEWKNDAKAFIDYISNLEHCGRVGYTLDRIDNNGNYEPGNVRFASKTTQSRNQQRHKGKQWDTAENPQ